MKRPPKTVAIVGGTLWGNRGAEAMLVTTIGRLRRKLPDARFLVFSYYPQRDAELCTDPQIRFYDYRPLNLALRIAPLALLTWLLQRWGIGLPDWLQCREWRALREADVLCDIGGITFCDGREIFLLYNVLSLWPALALKIPVVKLSQAMGPFHSLSNRFFARRVLGRCQQVFARGAATARHLGELSLPQGRWQQAADVAFCFDAAFSLTRENDDRLEEFARNFSERPSPGQQTVAIIPSSLVMRKDRRYVDHICRLIEDLASSDVDILLLPNATRAGTDKARNNDLTTIQHIVQNLAVARSGAGQRVFAVDFDINTAGIRELLSLADMAVTSRFHGMVAALHAGLPVVVVGWSHKYGEVLASFDCQDYGCDHADDHLRLSPLVLEVLARQPILSRRIAAALPAVELSSRSQFDYLYQLLDADTTGPLPGTAAADEACVVPVLAGHVLAKGG
jgi:polysaccharide pyruvyl transferase WcaK-like protein